MCSTKNNSYKSKHCLRCNYSSCEHDNIETHSRSVSLVVRCLTLALLCLYHVQGCVYRLAHVALFANVRVVTATYIRSCRNVPLRVPLCPERVQLYIKLHIYTITVAHIKTLGFDGSLAASSVRIYGTQVLPGRPPRAIYKVLSNLYIKYKWHLAEILNFKNSTSPSGNENTLPKFQNLCTTTDHNFCCRRCNITPCCRHDKLVKPFSTSTYQVVASQNS